MTKTLHILFCDDDAQFASESVAELLKRLSQNPDFMPGSYAIQPISNLHQLRQMVSDAEAAKRWDIICCDLGWGDLILEGIQILHDIQMKHPKIHTLLYTAQDANDLVDQALEWKLHFIDHVMRVDKASFYKDVAAIIGGFLNEQGEQAHFQRQKKSSKLVDAVNRYPDLSPHDLIPLLKSAYITFIQETYGGFPQMAIARGLDLNHVYRVNRRFKNSPYVVFKWETVQEIVGTKEINERIAQIKSLLCTVKTLQKSK